MDHIHLNGHHGPSPLSMFDQAVERVKSISRGPSPGPSHHLEEQLVQDKADLRSRLKKVAASLESLKGLVKAIEDPLPTETGDGTSLSEEHYESPEERLKDIAKDLVDLGVDPENPLSGLIKVKESLITHEPLDDRKYYMEKLIQAAVKVYGDDFGDQITNGFITALWADIKHPPEMHVSTESQYRSADGSGNCSSYPSFGAARQPYARTVASKAIQPVNLPDPALIFDSVMVRKNEKGTPHPNGISSMLFYLASIIIHDAFRTDHGDFNMSNTSSYLDLSPLYGSDQGEQDRMRTFADGKIYPDCFSETRLLSFPPGVGALLIMYNRFHNYVVEQLAAINENNRFPEPKEPQGKDNKTKYDEDLFQTGRLITCGLYVNTILFDYVRTILNTNKTDSNWALDPRVEIPGGPNMGVGNQVSAEFNLVYRWHATTSVKDDRWTQQKFAELFKGKKPDEVSQRDFIIVLSKLEKELTSQEPHERPFAELTRQHDGTYKDDDLVDILVSSIGDCANTFGPQQVPKVMKAIEVMGIQQARSWNLASLNEFRKHFGLAPHKTFSDITKNTEVADALKHLYDHPDNVELYPGLVVEDAKEPKFPGSGLCPSFTVSRAVLSDAVALVRGDRFYTTSYTPKHLTNWGFAEAATDLTIDNGCVFYKLFLRAFPNSFKANSVYVHYPLTIPSEMERVLRELGKEKAYDFSVPKATKDPQLVFSYAAAEKVLHDKINFKVTWGEAIEFLFGKPGKDFMLAGDNESNERSRRMMEKVIYKGDTASGPSRAIPRGNEDWLKDVREYYLQKTEELLTKKSYNLGGTNEIDLVRDIGNMVHVHFAADMFAIPLKTEANPHGVFTEQQLYMITAAVFICIFFDVDPAQSFPLRQKASGAVQQLGKVVEMVTGFIKNHGRTAKVLQELFAPNSLNTPMSDYGIHVIERLLQAEPDAKTLAWGNIMGTAGGMVANQGQLLGQALDYLFTEGAEHRTAIHYWANQEGPESEDKLMHYMLEATRLAGETGVFRSVANDITLADPLANDPTRSLSLKAGDRIMVVLRAASRDPAVFGPDPDKLDLTHDVNKYIHLGHGVHQCLGLPMVRVSLTAMLRVIFRRLPNLKPAKVYSARRVQDSTVKKIRKSFGPAAADHLPESWHYHAYMTEDWDQFWPFPTSLKVTWGNEPVDEKKVEKESEGKILTNGGS